MNSLLHQAQTVSADQLRPSSFLKQTRGSDSPDKGKKWLPAWVEDDGEGQYRVLWKPRGSMETGQIPVIVIDPADQASWEWTLTLWERLDQFSVLEKSRVLVELSERNVGKQRLLGVMQSYLDLPRSESWLGIYRSITSYGESVKQALKEGRLDPRHLHYLRSVDDSLASTFLKRAAGGSFSLSVQQTRQWVEALRRLKDEQQAEIHTWFKQETDDELTGGKLLEMTRQRAYPDTSARREKFQETLKTLSLPGSIRVRPPKNFEGDYLDFRIRCNRDQSLSELAEELKQCRLLLKHV